MSSESTRQHELEFGGSHVGTDFDGRINFRLHDGVPVITLTYAFDETSARQFRYLMGSTLKQEYHFHQRYDFLVVDLRAVDRWEGDSVRFLAEMRDVLRGLGGDLHLVTYETRMLDGTYPTHETVDEALAAVRAARETKRRS